MPLLKPALIGMVWAVLIWTGGGLLLRTVSVLAAGVASAHPQALEWVFDGLRLGVHVAAPVIAVAGTVFEKLPGTRRAAIPVQGSEPAPESSARPGTDNEAAIAAACLCSIVAVLPTLAYCMFEAFRQFVVKQADDGSYEAAAAVAGCVVAASLARWRGWRTAWPLSGLTVLALLVDPDRLKAWVAVAGLPAALYLVAADELSGARPVRTGLSPGGMPAARPRPAAVLICQLGSLACLLLAAAALALKLRVMMPLYLSSLLLAFALLPLSFIHRQGVISILASLGLVLLHIGLLIYLAWAFSSH